jgi:hypothetical protein
MLHLIALKKVQKEVLAMHQTKVTTAIQGRERGEFGQAWLLEQGLVVTSLEIIGIVGDMRAITCVRKVAWQALNHTTLWLAMHFVGGQIFPTYATQVSRLWPARSCSSAQHHAWYPTMHTKQRVSIGKLGGQPRAVPNAKFQTFFQL